MSWFIAAQGHETDPDCNDHLTSKWLVLNWPTGGWVSLPADTEGDVTAQTGVTLGGEASKQDGTWEGCWTPLAPSSAGVFTVKVPAVSAAIIRLGGT